MPYDDWWKNRIATQTERLSKLLHEGGDGLSVSEIRRSHWSILKYNLLISLKNTLQI